MKLFINAILSLLMNQTHSYASDKIDIKNSEAPIQNQSNISESLQKNLKVEKYKLANGLTVLLHEDHTSPQITYQTWFHVGSKNEEKNYSGMAHLFEHLMFKGAQRYTGEEYESTLQANGGMNNAFTTHDYTGYYEKIPSSKLELVMDLESDRMASLIVQDTQINSEREVVKEERRMRVDNNPMGILHEQLFSLVFKGTSYEWPVIGYMPDLDRVDAKKAQEFFKTYYAPNNAVIVIAGDFQSQQAKELIEKYYGKIQSQKIPEFKFQNEIPKDKKRIQYLTKDVQNISLASGYLVPGAGTPESYALDILGQILGHGSSSRLYKSLVYRHKLASQVMSANQTLQHLGVFQSIISLNPGADLEKVQSLLKSELYKLRTQKISHQELERAKKEMMKIYVDGIKTVFGKSELLAMNEIFFTDYSMFFKDLEYYQKVTEEDILAVAKKYLTLDKSHLVILKPSLRGKK